ncbi:MAG: transcriptional repressor LexA [Oscillospiraceae bacterium]|nr:transcriptional repressor LexA [Oscillospiraceae bacterium]
MGRPSNNRERILAFIQDFIRENGYSPSVREIGDGVGLKSTASVHYQLAQLQRAGLLTADSGKNRTIAPPDAGREIGRIPIVGVVRAGQPILAAERIEGAIPWEGDSGCFALRVKGDSMQNAGILQGDLVIVRPQQSAEHGDIVVALLGDEATVKRLDLRGGEVWLMPENPNYEPIDGRDAVIVGKVKAVVREY